MSDLDASKAVIRAGYSCKNVQNARIMGSKLLKHPGIRTAIDALMAERRENSDVTSDYVLRKIVRTLERCENDDDFNPQAVLRAAELLGKHLSMWVDRQEISGADGEAIKYEKIVNDADAFTRSIASLARREGEGRGAEETSH